MLLSFLSSSSEIILSNQTVVYDLCDFKHFDFQGSKFGVKRYNLQLISLCSQLQVPLKYGIQKRQDNFEATL